MLSAKEALSAIIMAVGLITSPSAHTIDIPAESSEKRELPRAADSPVTIDLQGAAEIIAACESGHRRPDGTAERGTHRWGARNMSSSASGAFQFLDGTWVWVWQDLIGEDPPTPRAYQAAPHDQYRAFHALWNGGSGENHWRPSRQCWDGVLRNIGPSELRAGMRTPLSRLPGHPR